MSKISFILTLAGIVTVYVIISLKLRNNMIFYKQGNYKEIIILDELNILSK